MPNWCQNFLTLRHSDPAMIARAKTALESGQFLQEFIPCPQELIDTESVYYPEGHEKKAAHDQRIASNVEKYGFKDWYDWCLSNWNTKWDIGEVEVEWADSESISARFETAWSPPTTAYAQLVEMGFSIEAHYYEPGMSFCGTWIDDNDDFYQIPQDLNRAREVIPEVLNDTFGIIADMSDWIN